MKTIKRTLPLLIIIAALFYFLPKNGSVSPGNLLAQGPTSTPTQGPTSTPTQGPTSTPTSTPPPLDLYSCDGFEPPMDKLISVKKKNRVLPLKMELLDADGYAVTDLDITAPPVVEVDFLGEGPAVPEEEDFLFAGQGDEGNQFVFTEDGKWQFNLQTKNFSGPGAYMISAVSGDSGEYTIAPSCTATFTIDE